MCLLVVLSRTRPELPLVVAANRDERYERPATAVEVLRTGPPMVLGGRDHLAGGTWLAVSERGVVAALTNRPTPGGRDPSKRSRGELPLRATSLPSAAEGVEALAAELRPGDYNPCWMLVGDRQSLHLVDVSGDAVRTRDLPAGLHALENRPYGEPSAKLERVHRLVGDHHELDGAHLHARLVAMLSDHTVPEGAPDERPELAACCVHSEGYGTRSATVVEVGADPGTPPRLWVADGPPCHAAFVERSDRFAAPDGGGTPERSGKLGHPAGHDLGHL